MQLDRKQATLAAANDTLNVQVDQADKVAFQITGTMTTMTVTFQGTIDGTNYVSIGVTPAAGGSVVSTATAVGVWTFDCAPYANVQMKVTSYTAGSVTGTVARARTFL